MCIVRYTGFNSATTGTALVIGGLRRASAETAFRNGVITSDPRLFRRASRKSADGPRGGREARHSASSCRRLVLARSISSVPPPDRIVLVAYRVNPLISP